MIIVEVPGRISAAEAIRRLLDKSRSSVCQAAGLAANTYKKVETGEPCSLAHARSIIIHLTGEVDDELVDGVHRGKAYSRFELRPLEELEGDQSARQREDTREPAG